MVPTSRERARRIWKKLLLIPAGCAAGLVIGWGGIVYLDANRQRPQIATAAHYATIQQMLDGDHSERGLYLFDEQIGFRFKPNYSGLRHRTSDKPHQTNSLGLLGEREIETDPAVRKVLVLGDSVAYGDGLPFESIFVSRMQDLAGPQYQLVNGACPGWNLQQQIGFLETRPGDVEWSAVVLAICLNDFVDFTWAASSPGRFDWMMTEYYSTFDLIWLANTRSRFARNEGTHPLSDHDDACMFAWQSDRVTECLQQQLTEYIEAPDRPPLILVMLPTRHQISALNRGVAAKTALLPQSRVAEFCETHRIVFLDAAELLAQGRERLPMASSIYLPTDALHFNDLGHEQLAAALWPALRQELSAF